MNKPDNRQPTRHCTVALLLGTPTTSLAHSFGEPVQLPLPYWLYIYGAMAALILSFLVFGFVMGQPGQDAAPRLRLLPRLERLGGALRLRAVLGVLLLAAFALAIASGLLGTRDPFRNFNMTFFWILFALGGLYLSVLIGGWYAAFGPWPVLARALGRFARGRTSYPPALAYWPAVLLYLGFIGIELFGHNRPFSLSVLLLAYTALNLLAVWAVGARAWLRHGELFSVMFTLVARMAPLQYRPEAPAGQRLRLRPPLAGLLRRRIEHPSLLIFLLFMLSSTAFDGLRETALWFNLFWKDPFHLLTPLLGRHPIHAYVELRPWFIAYESLWLILSPLLYLLLFGLFLWLGRLLARSSLSLTELAMRFGYSLLPIAVVYHLTHYYSLLLSQGVKIRALISDPFGWQWDLFGTAISGRVPILPAMQSIWYSQVALILLGHVASVYLAHAQALDSFEGRRRAALSQLPMLALMVIFTGVGLWILAQPLKG